MSEPCSGLRADLHRTRDDARAVGDARFELDVEITIILCTWAQTRTPAASLTRPMPGNWPPTASAAFWRST